MDRRLDRVSNMIAHMGHWTSMSWILLSVFFLVLIVGIVLAFVAARGRGGRRARGLLAERMARGELSPEEYRAHTDALGPAPRRILTPVATVLTAAGLLGTILVAATNGPGFMHGMMGGGMGSMMQSGETGRSGSAPVAGARAVGISGREFSFSPAEIRVAAGETINVRFDNDGHMFHTLTIGALGLDLRADDGDEITGSLTATEPGSYQFLCAVSGHADAGMTGTVTVSER